MHTASVFLRRRAVALLLPIGLLLAACGVESAAAPSATGPESANPVSGASVTGPDTAVPTVPADPLAVHACRLLDRADLVEAFGTDAVGPPRPVDPYCQWQLDGGAAWVALQVVDRDVDGFRRSWGASRVADAPVGAGAYFANNKALVFGDAGRTYVLWHQVSGRWDDSSRPMQVAAARRALARARFAHAAPEPSPLTAPVAVDAARTPSEGAPLRVWVGGDSLAGGPSWAIGERLAVGGVEVTREFHVGSGLNRPDFFDWPRHLDAQVHAVHPDVMVLMFGGNDTQPVVVDGQAVPVGDPRWPEAYRRRVAQVLDVTARDGRVVVWVGLPPMEDPELSAGAARINQVVAGEVARHPGATFVDTWTPFSAPGRPGTYVAAVPVDGRYQTVRLDGLHLNTTGSQVLADLVLPVLRRGVPALPAS